MKIKRLILKNVRCYKSIDLNFEFVGKQDSIRKRTIILGNNGTGKSTILRSIALLLSGSSALGELIGNPNSWIKHGSQFCIIKGVLETAEGEERRIELKININDKLSKIISRNQDSLTFIDRALEYTERNYLNIGYGIHRRIGGSGFENKTSIYNSIRAENVATLFNSQSSLYPFESWIMDIDYQQGSDGLKRIKKWLNKLIPESKFHSIDKNKKKVLFKNKDGIIDFDQLSDGFQITANWLGDLLYRITKTYSDYSNPTKSRFILLIDEIGLHLHPSWQRTIIQKITNIFPNAQIIATTHSPFVAQQAGEEELYTIIRGNRNKLDLFHYENDPRKLLIHQIIMSDIFGITTDESVFVEQTKNKIRNDPSVKDEAIIKTSFVGLKNVDNLSEIPLNRYTHESESFQDAIEKLKEEAKRIQDEKTE